MHTWIMNYTFVVDVIYISTVLLAFIYEIDFYVYKMFPLRLSLTQIINRKPQFSVK